MCCLLAHHIFNFTLYSLFLAFLPIALVKAHGSYLKLACFQRTFLTNNSQLISSNLSDCSKSAYTIPACVTFVTLKNSSCQILRLWRRCLEC